MERKSLLIAYDMFEVILHHKDASFEDVLKAFKLVQNLILLHHETEN